MDSPKFKRLRTTTQKDYRNKLNAFLADFGDAPVSVITRGKLHSWWEIMYAQRGNSMANGCVLVVSSMFSYGCLIDWLAENPALRLHMVQVPPRVVIWTPEECELIVRIGDQIGGHAERCADAFVIALHTGQRQRDVLDLDEPMIMGGTALIRQSKTSKRVDVPFTPALAQRLSRIRERRQNEPVTRIDNARKLILRPDGEPYQSFHFRHQFRKLRRAAALKMPSIEEKKFIDTRDTAVTRLALANCTIPHIHAITGHSIDTIHKVIKHYLAVDSAMARTGINQLTAWLAQEGISV